MCVFYAGMQALHISRGHSLEGMVDKKADNHGVAQRESSIVKTVTESWAPQGEGFFGTGSGAGGFVL